MTDRPQDPGQAEVAATIHALYEALGDRAAFDAHLHPDLTIWESDAAELLGLAGLDALRDERARRRVAGPSPAWVRPEELVVDRWDSTAVVRYVLRAHVEGAEADETFRVTDVLRPVDGRWLIVHHHAERWPAPGTEPG